MSYSISIPKGPRETFAERADEALANGPCPDDQREGAAAAIEAVKQLAASGNVGNEATHLQGSVSGHCNPGHEARAGYASETMNISVQETSTNSE